MEIAVAAVSPVSVIAASHVCSVPNGRADRTVPTDPKDLDIYNLCIRPRQHWDLGLVGSLSGLRDTSSRGLLRHALDYSAASLWLRLRWRPASFADDNRIMEFRCRRNDSLMLAFRRAKRSWPPQAATCVSSKLLSS